MQMRKYHWPILSDIKMSRSDIEDRAAHIGGSDANIILSGDTERVSRLWAEKIATEQPADLSHTLPVMLGCWTEDFNRQWYMQATGLNVSEVGKVMACEEVPWRRCTLDGYVKQRGAVWEAKHTNAFTSADEVIERYMPQLQHNMAVAKSDRAYLSVIFGNHKWEVLEIAADWLYQEELLIAETRFYDCVRHREPPVAMPPPLPPKPVGVREISLEGNNAWASAAHDWLVNGPAARLHASAAAALKKLVEADVSRAFGHGVEARRSKSGAITLKDVTQ
jgi:predicted phage-related endonuclease